MSRRSSAWPTPSSTSGRAGSPASPAFSVRIRWQKLWKFDTAMRPRTVAPTVASSRSRSSRAAHPLDDDPRLSGPGPRDDHHRTVAPLDYAALVISQIEDRLDDSDHRMTIR